MAKADVMDLKGNGLLHFQVDVRQSAIGCLLLAHCVGLSMSAVGSNAAVRQLRFLGVALATPMSAFSA